MWAIRRAAGCNRNDDDDDDGRRAARLCCLTVKRKRQPYTLHIHKATNVTYTPSMRSCTTIISFSLFLSLRVCMPFSQRTPKLCSSVCSLAPCYTKFCCCCCRCSLRSHHTYSTSIYNLYRDEYGENAVTLKLQRAARNGWLCSRCSCSSFCVRCGHNTLFGI